MELSTLFQDWDEGFLVCDPLGKALQFNAAYSEFLRINFNSDISPGVVIYELLPGKYRPGRKELHERVLTGERQRVEFSVRGQDDQYRFYEIVMTPVREGNSAVTAISELIRDISDSKEKLMEIQGLNQDLEKRIIDDEAYYLDSNIVLAREIAERKQAEENLQESKERLSQIIHGNSIPTFVIDSNHIITHWNKACESLTGFSSEEMVGTKEQWKAFYLRERPTIADLVVEQAKADTIGQYYENKYRKSTLLDDAYEAEDFFDFGEDGKWLFFTAAPLRNISGGIIGAIETLQDITDRKRMENEIRDYHKILEQRIEERTEQLKITYEQLLHAEKLSAVGKLAASIAHEFGNPIIGIRNFLKGLLKSSSFEEADKEVLELAISECQRVKDLISNLQNFNRPTTGTVSSMDLHKAIDDLLLFCKKNLKEKHIKVVKQYDSTLPEITAVSDQIKQVILNCLNNAAESISQEKGVITIATEVQGEQVKLHITDTGKGISKADIDYIFEPFFSTKPAVEGSGLGLSVSYGIIKRHCGNIEVSATSEQGTTFTITLPVEGVG